MPMKPLMTSAVWTCCLGILLGSPVADAASKTKTKTKTAAPAWLTMTDQEFATDSTYVNQASANDSSFAWYLFARANQPIHSPAKGKKSYTVPRHWEQWATNSQTFPASKAPVAWDSAKGRVPNEMTSPTLLDLKTGNAAGVTTPNEFKTDNEETRLNLGAVVEEVRRNKGSYEHIRTQGLYCADILVDYPVAKFPAGALEVKAEWRPRQASDTDGTFYTAQTEDGTVYVLIGFHIMSKALPNWFWATWEHQSNPLRGRLFTSQIDTFGFKNDSIPTANLKKILTAAGMDTDLWTHYRVVNWQNGFNTPKVAGNSVIEGVLSPNSSSCITCHAIAGADKIAKTAVGQVNFPALTEAISTETVTFKDVTPVGGTSTTVELDFKNTGYVGTPPKTTGTGKGKSILANFNKFDFVWSLFRAKQTNTPSCTAIAQAKTKPKVDKPKRNTTATHKPRPSH